MKKIIKRGRRPFSSGGEGGDDRIFFIFFLYLVFFLDLLKSDFRFLSRLNSKLIYAMRATRGHQRVGISTNSVR